MYPKRDNVYQFPVRGFRFKPGRSDVKTEASRPEPGKKGSRHCHTVDRNSKREISKIIGSAIFFEHQKCVQRGPPARVS
jgi:hypothetical protein